MPIRLLLAFVVSAGLCAANRAAAADATPVPVAACAPVFGLDPATALCVNVIHVAAGSPAFDVRIVGEMPCPTEIASPATPDGTPEAGCGFGVGPPALDFGQQTGFLAVAGVAFELSIAPAGSGQQSAPLLSMPFSFDPGGAVEIYITGDPGTLQFRALITDLSPVPPSETVPHRAGSRIRVFNAAFDAPPVNVVEISGDIAQRLASDLSPGDAGDYRNLPAGKRQLMVQIASDGTTLWSQPDFDFPANTVSTLVVTISRSTGEVRILPISVSLAPAAGATPTA